MYQYTDECPNDILRYCLQTARLSNNRHMIVIVVDGKSLSGFLACITGNGKPSTKKRVLKQKPLLQKKWPTAPVIPQHGPSKSLPHKRCHPNSRSTRWTPSPRSLGALLWHHSSDGLAMIRWG